MLKITKIHLYLHMFSEKLTHAWYPKFQEGQNEVLISSHLLSYPQIPLFFFSISVNGTINFISPNLKSLKNLDLLFFITFNIFLILIYSVFMHRESKLLSIFMASFYLSHCSFLPRLMCWPSVSSLCFHSCHFLYPEAKVVICKISPSS